MESLNLWHCHSPDLTYVRKRNGFLHIKHSLPNYQGKSINIRNAVVLVFLLAALVVLRRWRMRGFIVIISAQI